MLLKVHLCEPAVGHATSIITILFKKFPLNYGERLRNEKKTLDLTIDVLLALRMFSLTLW